MPIVPRSEVSRGMVTRIAPTPSGFLHEGNAVSFLLTAWWAAVTGGRILLRIDDFDAPRSREEYLADVFDTLAWLGIPVSAGPRDTADFRSHWSMAHRRGQFEAARDELLAHHPDVVFGCRCSRGQLTADGFCAAGCQVAGHPFLPGENVLRLHVDLGGTVPSTCGGGIEQLAVPPGDHVLWRRDDLPAYQLGSVVVDEELGITAIVRGMDLLDSTALQLHLARLLPAPTFTQADVRHHGLLRDPEGRKLSKSAGARLAPLRRTPTLRAEVQRWAAELGAPIGIDRPG